MRQVAVAAARDAGRLIRENVNRMKKVSLKTSETDLVTEIDQHAEEIVREYLERAFPDHTILGEEGVEPGTEAADRALKEAYDAAQLWIVDPIDGTTNFVHSFPFFCVSIALAQRGELKLGVIYDPIMDEWFIAEKGKGATLNGERLSVSKEARLAESLVASGFPRGEDGEPRDSHAVNAKALFALLPRVRNIRTAGSAALNLAYVAAGRLSAFWEYALSVWDIAAGVLMIEEAGGRVSDTLGRPYDLGVRHIVGTNGLIHDALIDTLSEAGATEIGT